MKKLFMIAIMLGALAAQAGLVQLDLHNAYNYDAVATRAEIDYAAGLGKSVYGALGDHALRYVNRLTQPNAFGSDPAGSIKGLAADGLIAGGKYELGKGLTDKYGTATGNAKVNNAVSRLQNGADGILTRTATISLEAADRKKYSNFNVLLNGNRYATTATTVTFGALIQVKYVGDSNWYTVWSESQLGGTGGGAFGGPLDASTYALCSSAWQSVLATDKGYAKYTAPATVMGLGSVYMWELATPLALDPTKTLESFQLTSTTTTASRYNEFILYAATGTEVIPEPATVGMLGLGALVTLLIRRVRA